MGEKSEHGILNWKSIITNEDIDYKGFTQLKCTDKCIVDFHPWCWKHKKDNDSEKEKHEGLHKPLWDKDYLKLKCPTPDCNAPVYKVSIFKDDLEWPLELTDDELTRKILAGGKPKRSHKPSECKHKIEDDDSGLESKHSTFKVKNLDESQTSNVKCLNRQIRELQKEIDFNKGQTEKYENANKLLRKENANLEFSQFQRIDELRYQNQQLLRKNNQLRNDAETEPNYQDERLCDLVLQTSSELENSVENISKTLLENGVLRPDLSRMHDIISDRIKKAKEILQQSPETKNAAQIEALIKINMEAKVFIFNINAYLFGEEEINEPSDS